MGEIYVNNANLKEIKFIEKNNPDIYKKRYAKWRSENPDRAKQSQKMQMKKLRNEILDNYGRECACCGENRKEFLTLDHVNGNGAEHRRETRGHTYRDLRKQGFPKDGYRILCWNCNASIGMYGYCPHDKEKKTQTSK